MVSPLRPDVNQRIVNKVLAVDDVLFPLNILSVREGTNYYDGVIISFLADTNIKLQVSADADQPSPTWLDLKGPEADKTWKADVFHGVGVSAKTEDIINLRTKTACTLNYAVTNLAQKPQIVVPQQ